ncbi:MAG: hypothetical protein IKE95_09710 [Methanobrevibacter sp.]|nr:hypothetical protein [Methanobrevibacter sp.]
MANTLDKIRLSGVTYDIIDATAVHSLDGYYTSGQTNDAITAATSALAETIAEQHYQTSGDVQNAISGKADTSAVTAVNDVVTAHTANTDIHVTTADKTAWNAKADISDIPSVSGYADSVKYNSTSKYVEFYHGGTGGTKVFEYDASPFLIDGMVQNVEIKSVEISGVATTCLVISFNTDAGKQDINIPISEIFDASNYYTTAETDNKIAEATSGKADTSAVTAVNDVVTAHTANTNIHLDATEKANIDSLATNIETISGITSADTASWTGKQDALVSGTNIKTVGGNSLLGSGDVPFPPGMTAEVSGTTLIFS